MTTLSIMTFSIKIHNHDTYRNDTKQNGIYSVMLSVIYAVSQKAHYAECRYVECRYAEYRYAECHYAECRYADCRYAECRGAIIYDFCDKLDCFWLASPFSLV